MNPFSSPWSGALLALGLILSGSLVSLRAADPGWVELFDGKSLEGWRANERPGSFRVIDGAIVCDGPRSHLFYAGTAMAAEFRDFELEAEVNARPGANSGVYFHTKYQEKDWPVDGFEVQVNNTATGEGGYRENKRTGSLYAIRNVYRQLVPDDAWFRLRIRVLGRRVAVFVNDVQTVDYVEPVNAPNGGYSGRKIGSGTFALQCHDEGSRVAFRHVRVRSLPVPANLEPAPVSPISRELANLQANNFPMLDLQVQLADRLGLADVVQRQFRTGIGAGLVVSGGGRAGVTNDATLLSALNLIRHPLLFTAFRAEGREWTRQFSASALARFDYVFTDARTIVDDQGRPMRLWIPKETRIGDPQAFMELLARRTVEILENEPIQLLANPLFLPDALSADRDRLWTAERRARVIAAAATRKIAIEINDRLRLPGADFVREGRAAGVKFAFGTSNQGREDLGNLDYCVGIVRECGLKWSDIWVPEPKR